MADQPSPEARQDYDALLNALMPFAEQMLRQHGEFFPFGAAINTAGQVTAHATYDGNELPPSEEVIASLTKVFQSEAREGKIRAAGICYDGRIVQGDKKVDAVMITMEHQSGQGTKACVPYTKNWFGKYKFGELIAGLEKPKIFVSA